jgi:hypothetical protein
MEDRAGEYDAALGIFGQWTRAEPEFCLKTAEELEAEIEQRLAAPMSASTRGWTRQRKSARRARPYTALIALQRQHSLTSQSVQGLAITAEHHCG